jgi:glucose-1-phosphate cytidylyltransferase
MKAVILCGGKGTRLVGETEFKPKPLVKVGGKPILWHIIKIYASQGVKEFILCLGYKGDMIKEYFLNLREMSEDFVLDLSNHHITPLGNNGKIDIKISFIDTGEDSMTGARVARIKKYIGEDEDFFLTYGDGLADVNLKELYKYHKEMNRIGTITAVSPFYKFGIVEVQEDLIKKFDEKPEMRDLINGGFMVLNKKFFNYLSTDKSCILEQEPLKNLAKEGQLSAYHHKGYWQCMDTQKEVDLLNEDFVKGAPWTTWERNEECFEKDAMCDFEGENKLEGLKENEQRILEG